MRMSIVSLSPASLHQEVPRHCEKRCRAGPSKFETAKEKGQWKRSRDRLCSIEKDACMRLTCLLPTPCLIILEPVCIDSTSYIDCILNWLILWGLWKKQDVNTGAREMLQCFRALVIFPEELCSIPSTHMATSIICN